MESFNGHPILVVSNTEPHRQHKDAARLLILFQMEKKKEETTEKQSRKANIADMVQSQVLPLADITPNKGQIPGVPKNPRLIHDDKFKLLKRSIEEDPEMLGLREILLYPYKGKNIIVGGNMRYRALKELGYTEAIVKILPQAFTA